MTGSGRPPLASLPADQAITRLQAVPLGATLAENLAWIRQVFDRCSDLVEHRVEPNDGQGLPAVILYMDGLVDQDLLERDVLTPLLKGMPGAGLQQVARGLTPVAEAKQVTTAGDLAARLLDGEAILLLEGQPRALSYGLQGWESRAVSEPLSEAVIRGPREAFVETLRFNTAMLRRKLRSPGLKMESLTIGRISRTIVVLAYLEGVVEPGIVQEVLTRLKRIDVDGVLESGYLEQFMEDSPFSPFPQVQNTERPDTAAAQLLEGRVAILTEGTPFVLIVPTTFAQLMQSSEDYYERFLIGSFIRGLRYAFLVVALLLPSLYVAVITFHQEMMPTALLLSVAAARESVPFPALVEALMMEVTFEILREAGIRLPKPVGQAVSIVGALVIGEAAVRAGMVSAPMVIVVSITGIAAFAIPRYNASAAIRLLRFALMFLAGSLGMFGIMAGLTGILLHMCSLRSVGVPYLSPLAPMHGEGLKDVVIRGPLWWLRRRPRFASNANRVRTGAGAKPGLGPPGGGDGR